MTWALDGRIDLASTRIDRADSDRQMRTAAEICRRLNDQPGVVLADGVGMGKTFVALAVAASVALSTERRAPVVVMVPPGVKEKWPREWAVFEEHCLAAGTGLRATTTTITRGSEFLKLLDDEAPSRHDVIFLTHGALTSRLNDPFTKLAIVRQAFRHQGRLSSHKRAFARWAAKLLDDPRMRPDRAAALMAAPPGQWRRVWERCSGEQLEDDPVPDALLTALETTDLTELRNALATMPLRDSANLRSRLSTVRRTLRTTVESTWKEGLRRVDVRLPLLILDEAHHLKNPNQLKKLFEPGDGESDAEAPAPGGPLAGMFDHMLFLTATPFQLGHRELLRVIEVFAGVRQPREAAREFGATLDELGAALDAAQASALRLERAWSRLTEEDLASVAATPAWWDLVTDEAPDTVRSVVSRVHECRDNLEACERLLRPWVIRHDRAAQGERRRYRPGAAILGGEANETGAPASTWSPDRGLEVSGDAILPFLLAARAQAVVARSGLQGHRSTRAYFAEGLSSSFEAYAETRSAELPDVDEMQAEPGGELPATITWYLDHIEQALPSTDDAAWAEHPKIAATTRRVVELWHQGEKVLVFCFYRATGRALRAHISRALQRRITDDANARLGQRYPGFEALVEDLEARADRLLRKDGPGARAVEERVREIAAQQTADGAIDDTALDGLVDATLRFMRTPSFLVRHVDLAGADEVSALVAALDVPDDSRLTLGEKVADFARHLGQLVDEERSALMDAVLNIRTGRISAAATSGLYDPAEVGGRSTATLPNVRLANGGVRSETRQRLMLTFNTPFFPEVLIASAVMAEGIDLHLDCRHVIHHDLDWNPSVLEQRTGRLDRIHSKAERCGQPVVVYEPFVAGTQDEKMFRVVKDRDRWFNVVMGQPLDVSEWATDQLARRVPLPVELAQELRLDLSL